MPERRVEFDDQVGCELENSHHHDQIHEGSLANGCHSAREKHECKNQVQSNSPASRQTNHGNKDCDEHEKREKETQSSVRHPKRKQRRVLWLSILSDCPVVA